MAGNPVMLSVPGPVLRGNVAWQVTQVNSPGAPVREAGGPEEKALPRSTDKLKITNQAMTILRIESFSLLLLAMIIPY